MATRLLSKQPERKRLRTTQTVKASAAPASGRAEGSAITAAASKYDDILKIYHDVRDGFGSIRDTWKAAKTNTLK